MYWISLVRVLLGSSEKMAYTLYLEEVIIPSVLMFVGHEQSQLWSPEWSGCHRLSCHVYFVQIDMQLKDAIVLRMGSFWQPGLPPERTGMQ